MKTSLIFFLLPNYALLCIDQLFNILIKYIEVMGQNLKSLGSVNSFANFY